MTERRFVIEVDGLPDPADQIELLELVLAAASLELPVTVLLTSDAVALLTSPASLAWRQLIEQDLADVAVAGDVQGAAVPTGVAVLSADQKAKLVGESTVIRA